MFIVTAKVPRRRHILLGALALFAVLAAVLVLRARSGSVAKEGERSQRAETNEARVAYLEALGWEVDGKPIEALRLTLPDEMAEPYRSYNELQLKQGFDLTPYLGETLERCTYRVTNYPGRPAGCQADLYLYRGEVVAGDVVCTGENGFIATLDYPSGA